MKEQKKIELEVTESIENVRLQDVFSAWWRINKKVDMKKIKYIMPVILCVLQSCFNSKSHVSVEDANILINIDSAKLVSLKVSDVRYIPLETSDECLIGHAHKVLIKKGRIYVADFSKAMALFVFDMTGKFIFQISKKGQGPGEYVSFWDFDIHNNGEIYMYDVSGRKILVYDSEGKNFREIKFDYNFKSFFLTENKIYLSALWGENGKKMAALAVYDITTGKTTPIFDDEKFLYNIPFNNSPYDFFQSSDRAYYSPKFSDIIYSISKDGVIPEIGINNLPLPPADVMEKLQDERDNNKLLDLIRESNYFLENVYIYETSKYISIGCKKGKGDKTLLHNKITNKTHALWLSAYFMEVGCSNIMGSTGKEFFGMVFFSSDNQYHKKILESRKELSNWQDDDNPVLVLFD